MWIEIEEVEKIKEKYNVTLFTRVWIEIKKIRTSHRNKSCHSLYESVNWNWERQKTSVWLVSSLSLRECELKLQQSCQVDQLGFVTLFTRVWIEISEYEWKRNLIKVTLFTRVWIEMLFGIDNLFMVCVTLFTRVWIEIYLMLSISSLIYVTLFTRVWIEIIIAVQPILFYACHSLYESVNWNLWKSSVRKRILLSLSLRECELK